MGSVYDEITRLETAKTDIETAIEECGVNVPDTELISDYASYIRQIPSAVFSGLNVDPVGGDDKYIKTIEQKNGLINATTGGLVSSTSSGLAPTIGTSASSTISTQSDEWVLTSTKGGSPTWRKLPSNAFKNDNTNTTYSLSGALSGNTYITTLTDSSSVKTTATIPAMSGASSTAAGTAGLVPAPAANKHTAFLRGDGTWVVPTNTNYYRPISVNGTSILGNNNTALNLVAGTNISITAENSSGYTGKVTITNTGVRSVATGTANGTISVNTNGTTANITVKGLGSAAYTSSDNYAVTKTLTNQNLNDVITPGFYNSGGGNTCSNKPENVDHFGMIVTHCASGTYYVQILFEESYSNLQYRRHCINGTWSNWTLDKLTDTTYSVVSSSANGLAPKVINTNTATVGSAYYVLASTNGSASPSWYKLPTNAFKNDNTTYTFVSGDGGFTVTPSGGTAQTVSIGKVNWTNITNKPDAFTPASHTHTTQDIITLTGYTKATTASDLATTDTLNAALGKLEYKADHAYNWIISVTAEDTDEYINKWGEIVGFLDSVKEGTDILDEFVTRKTDQTITGSKTFVQEIIITNPSQDNKSNYITFRNGVLTDGYYDYRVGIYNDSNNVNGFGLGLGDSKGVFTKFLHLTADGAYKATGLISTVPITATKFRGDLSNTLTFSAGAFAAKTYNNSAAVTVNIPTHTSHLINNSGFLTSRGYIGTTAVQASSAAQALTGITNLTMSGNLTITPGNTDNYITFAYSSGSTYSWRLGYLGTGSGDANYFVVQSAKAAGTSWNNAIRLGNETLDAAFGGNVYPLVNNSKTLGTSNYRWAGLYTTNVYSNAIYNGTKIYATGNEIIHADSNYFELNKGYSNVVMWLNASEYKFNVGSSGVQFMIASNGNVGIGSVGGAPAYKLHVGGGEVMADAYHAWSGGFKKNGSSDSYILLGGGGHKAISDFMLKSDALINNLTTLTKTLTVTKDWMDTGIKYNDLTTGTYAIQVYSHATGNSIWYGYWSGIMTWYGSTTNSSESDEILLHRGSHACNGNTIYLRTINTVGSDGRHLRLQIAANKNFSSATYTFKFKKLI